MKTITRIPSDTTIWRPIPGTDSHYCVSNKGQVKSFKYSSKGKDLKTQVVRKRPSDKGHLRVSLYMNGNRKRILVHRLVAQMFIPNPNNYPQVNHKDGNKHNNHYKNLEWGTQSDNMLHSVHVLKNPVPINHNVKGESNPAAKLKYKQIEEIRRLGKEKKLTQAQIGKKFNISRIRVNLIINKKIWIN